jgi:hypothetical protein
MIDSQLFREPKLVSVVADDCPGAGILGHDRQSAVQGAQVGEAEIN